MMSTSRGRRCVQFDPYSRRYHRSPIESVHTMEAVQWPPTPVSTEVKDLMSLFFTLMDKVDPAAGQPLAEEVFTPDASISTPLGSFKGKTAIAACRRHAWDTIIFRKHTIERVYVGDKSGKDLIVAGTVETREKDTAPKFSQFAARVIARGEADATRLKSYQAWGGIVTSV
ncbi:SnoaL-like domain-containing protein [Cladophialophora immunda]|nr:SnoaL-like domain-containing protein [Cladophialophora immunda]